LAAGVRHPELDTVEWQPRIGARISGGGFTRRVSRYLPPVIGGDRAQTDGMVGEKSPEGGFLKTRSSAIVETLSAIRFQIF